LKYDLFFRPEIDGELISGYNWYEEKAKGLGEDFLRIFYACVSDIQRNPLFYSKVHNDFRRFLLRRFPYAVYFRIEGDQIIVFALFHCARNPESVQDSLFGREKNS